MMRPDLCELLLTIAAAATDACAFAEGLTLDAFERLPSADPRTYRAIKNALTELGEAVKSVPPEVCARYPEIDWRGLAGLRNIVVHRYFALDLRRLWPVVLEELPVVLVAVQRELRRQGNETP